MKGNGKEKVFKSASDSKGPKVARRSSRGEGRSNLWERPEINRVVRSARITAPKIFQTIWGVINNINGVHAESFLNHPQTLNRMVHNTRIFAIKTQ